MSNLFSKALRYSANHASRRRVPGLVVACMVAVLAVGCGGSGSSGLFEPESVVFASVTASGDCRDRNGTSYCGIAAFAAGGETVSLSVGEPAGCVPVDGDPDCAADAPGVLLVPEGFGPEAECATATRVAGSEQDWQLSALQSVAAGTYGVESLGGAATETALLCFRFAGGELPATARVLADTGPDVIFVGPVLGVD